MCTQWSSFFLFSFVTNVSDHSLTHFKITKDFQSCLNSRNNFSMAEALMTKAFPIRQNFTADRVTHTQESSQTLSLFSKKTKTILTVLSEKNGDNIKRPFGELKFQCVLLFCCPA